MLPSTGYILERHAPKFFFVGVISFAYAGGGISFGSAKELACSFATIFSVFLGFITTSISILFSAQDKEFIKSLKSSGALKSITEYHHAAIAWCSVSIVVSLLYTIIAEDHSLSLYINNIKNIMLATSTAAFVSVVRVGYFYKKIISH